MATTNKLVLCLFTPLLVTSCLVTGASAAGIFECTNSQGQRVFTHHDCPRSHPERDLYNPEIASIYSSPTLSDEELNTLAAIDRREVSKSGRHQQSSQSLIRRDCATAQRELRAIRAQKRKGYALSDAGRLDAHEAKLKNERNIACY